MCYDGKVFCLITGGSRGFGRAVALAFAGSCNFTAGSVMVLTGRSEADLQETKIQVENVNSKIVIKIEVFDLGDMAALESFTSKLPNFGKSFDSAILINNAGSLGDISKKLTSPSSYEDLKKYFDFNVVSVCMLIQHFFNAFKSTRKVIVNVSSLAAINQMPYLSLYCTAKAARDMLHKALACEEEGARVLNYAPGPMETAMSMDIQQNIGDLQTREFFKGLRETRKIIDPAESAEKLVQLLKTDKYGSGDHIDFYDVEKHV